MTAYGVTLVDRQEQEHSVLFFEIEHKTDAMTPIDVMPVLRMFGGTISDISQVRRPIGTVDFLIGINCVSLFPVFAGDDEHRECNLRLLTSKFGTGWLLDGTQPSLKPGAMMTSGRAHAAWTTKWFGETPKKIVNTLRRTTPFVSLKREESVKEEQKNPDQIKVGLMLDPENNVTDVSVRGKAITQLQAAIKLTRAKKAAPSK